VTYAAIIALAMFYYEIKDKNLMQQVFYDVQTRQPFKATYITVLRYFLWKDYLLFATTMMLLATSIFLLYFMYYQFKLVVKNLTSSESNKQDRCIQYMKMIIEALQQIAERKKYKIVELKLNSRDIKKYKDRLIAIALSNIRSSPNHNFMKFCNKHPIHTENHVVIHIYIKFIILKSL
jgi:hypothetical protein